MTSAPAKSRGGSRRAPAAPVQGATAVLIATASSAGGTPAAALPWEGGTVLGRLLDQLAGLGVTSARVVARAEGTAALEPLLTAAPIDARLVVPESTSTALRTVAELARGGEGPLVIAYADVVTQREALAGLLFDPRIATGILSTAGKVARPFGYRTRVLRGRVVAAASPYHRVNAPNASFLGVLKVAAADRGRLAEVADEIAALLEAGIPPAWAEELEVKDQRWHRALVRGAIKRAGEVPPPDDEIDLGMLTPDDLAELERRLVFAREDVASLLVVGLVRADTHVGISGLRRLFWARPTSLAKIEAAQERIADHDEEQALLDSAVKQSDGFFTTFFVSPYSKYMARWAARRGLTPNQVTLISMGVGALAALAFANGGRAGLVAGAVLLQLAFTLDCVDGQLARYTRSFSKLGAWLDSIFDRGKEYLVYAGLAFGASRAGDPVWLLAGSALALQTMRHAIDFSYPTFQHQLIGTRQQPPIEHPGDRLREPPPVDDDAEDDTAEPPPPVGLRGRVGSLWRAGDRSSAIVWVKKVIAFPIGERFAVISITAALFTPEVTFIALLSWGGFAAAYVMVGRALRAARSNGGSVALAAGRPNLLDAFRDDGPVARAIGAVAGGVFRGPAVVLLLVALAPMVAAIVVKGDAATNGLVAAIVAWAVIAGGVASARPLTDRLRWAVPPVLRAIEFAGLLWIAAVAGEDSLPAAFALLCAIAYHHYDDVYGVRHRGVATPRWVLLAGGGWDGRLLLACALLLAGALPAGFYAMAIALACLFVGASIHGWQHTGRVQQTVYDDEEDEAD